MNERDLDRLATKLTKEVYKKFVLIKIEDWHRLIADIADMRDKLDSYTKEHSDDDYTGTRDDFRFMGEDC